MSNPFRTEPAIISGAAVAVLNALVACRSSADPEQISAITSPWSRGPRDLRPPVRHPPPSRSGTQATTKARHRAGRPAEAAMTRRPHLMGAGSIVACHGRGGAQHRVRTILPRRRPRRHPQQPRRLWSQHRGGVGCCRPGGGDDTAQLQAAVDRFDRIIIIGTLHVAGTVRITRPVEIRWRP